MSRYVEQLFLLNVNAGPMILIDGAHCPLLVQALKFHYRYKRKKNSELEDAPEKLHPWSDLVDCLQYMAMGMSGGYISKKISPPTKSRRPPPRVAGWT
jgi:hypothetical protein